MTQLTKLVCWFCGHDWESLKTFGLNASPLGHGLLIQKKCRRCGKEENVFECFANILQGVSAKTPAPLKPSVSRDLLSMEEESKDALGNSTQEKATEIETSAGCSEVSKCDECNKSQV